MNGTHDTGARRACCFAVLAFLLAASGCSGDTASDAPNLLLITLDTTRADHLGCYGSDTASTPGLDRLAAEGMTFDQAIAVGPITLPSHVSLLTGNYPPRHGVRLNGDFRLRGDETTLAEHLADRGYSTAAVVAAYVLSSDFGISQGFETYDEPTSDRDGGPGGHNLAHYEIVERPAGDVTDAAMTLLDGKLEEPFFLWLHYYDPHGEYDPPEPFAGQFPGRPYDGEIAYLDAELGRLFDGLRGDGRLDRTLVALTADHGESLGEHGENTHGLFVYDATQRVPLILRMPGTVPEGSRTAHLVSGVDLPPTLLELLDQPPLGPIDGVSFAAVARGGTLPPREPVYAEAELPLRSYGWSAVHALRDERYKLINAGQLELYDLRADPGETRNIALEAIDRLGLLAERLLALEASWPEAAPDAQQPLDAEARARLSALGYVSGGGEPVERDDRPNPRQFVQVHNLLLDIQTLVARGAYPEALELLDKALEVDPDNPASLELAGTLLCNAGRCAEGLERLQRAAQLAPRSYQTQRNLGNALHLAGRLPEAAVAYRAALELHPFAADEHYALGNVLFAAGDVAGAISSYEQAARHGMDAASFHAAFGVARAASGDLEGGRASLERAVEADPSLAEAWNQLGIVDEKQARLDQARDRYARAVELSPAHAGALFNLAKVSLRLGAVDAASEGVSRLLAAHPTYPAGRYLEAQVALARGDQAAARRAIEQFLSQENADPRLVQSARQILTDLGG